MTAGPRVLLTPGRGPAVTHLRGKYLGAWSNGCVVSAQIIHGDFNAAVCAASAVVDGGTATQVSVTDVDYQRVVYRWRLGGGN